jgi:hypothetical protein
MSATAAAPVFQSNRTVALIPKDARNKRQIRQVLAAFAEQFVAALVGRLTTYCELRKSKTVDSASLKRAAEELLGAGASDLPNGLAEDQLPQTIIFTRFKRSLGGLRTDAGCSAVAAIVGFHFLRYVQDSIERVYTAEADARAIKVTDLIAVLERPGKFSPSGLPTIAYRHDDAIFAAAATAEEGAAEEKAEPAPKAEEAAPAAPKAAKAAKASKAAAAPVEAAPVEAAPAKGKKAGAGKARKADEAAAAAAAAEPKAQEEEAAPAVKKQRRAPAKKAAAGAGAGAQ